MSSESTSSYGGAEAARSTASRSGFLRVLGWSYAMDAGQQGVGVILGFILAALLGPTAYGTVAMALVFILFIDLLQQQGLSSALIQRKALADRHLHTAFWMVMGVGVLMAAGCAALAGWWASVNGTPDLGPIVIALSALLPLRALSVVQEALLRRRMDFKALTIRTLAGVLTGGVAGVVAAVAGAGVWALVIQQLVGAFVAVVVLWLRSSWRPRAQWSTPAARDLLGFSTGSFLSGLGVFVNNKADAIVIGLFFGPLVVGIYRFGARIVEMVEGMTSRSTRSMVLPELAPWQDQPEEFALRLQRLLRLAGLVALPALGVLAAVAGPLIGLLGPEWAGAVTTTRILCVVAAIRVLCVVDGPLLQALGRPHLQAALTWLAAVASVGTFLGAAVVLVGRPEGEQAMGIALSRAVLFGSILLVMHVLILRLLTRVPLRRLAAAHAAPIAAGLGAAAIGLLLDTVARGALPTGWLILVVGGASTVLGMAILTVDPRIRREVIALARRRRVRSTPPLPRHDYSS